MIMYILATLNFILVFANLKWWFEDNSILNLVVSGMCLATGIRLLV